MASSIYRFFLRAIIYVIQEPKGHVRERIVVVNLGSACVAGCMMHDGTVSWSWWTCK